MYRRKSFISLSLSLVLAAGTLTAPVLAADEFTDGMGVETFSNTAQIPSAENGTEQETSSAKNQGKSNADADFNATVFTDGGENKAISGGDIAEFNSADDDITDSNVTDSSITDDTAAGNDFTVTERTIQELPDGSVHVTEKVSLNTDTSSNNDELFGEYANQFFYEKDAATAPATSIGESVLSGVQQALYEEMKTKVTNIAAKGGSTKFKITSDMGLRWQTSASGARLEKEVSQTFDNLDTDKVLSCLRTDCPYELYWYEKTANTEWSYNYSVSVSGGKRIVRITDLEVSMPVCNGYASDQYRVDASMVNIAKASAANAKQIVNEFKNSSVTEKLVAYKEMICYLTDYNDEAMSDSYADGYGDPWQLIWVFDGDDSTQVVCEGYSKAFQYLCDLSDITCYTVTGDMDGGTGAGPHMWNIVEQDGRYYMADITNSDKGTVGEDGDLFLNTPSYGSVSKGYTYETESGNIYFKYDKDTRDTYGTGANSVLQMTDKAYDVDNNTVKPSKPVISGISNKVAKRLTISWKKSQNAKGYEIYRRAGTTGSYRKVATIKSGNTVRYTNTGLRKGTKYYYRIRAYSYNALGKKVYSGWSAVKNKVSR